MPVRFLTVSNNETSKFPHAHLFCVQCSAYFKLRHDVFNQYSMAYYEDGPDKFDTAEDTVFVLLFKNTKVVGGRRIVVHTPGSQKTLKTEESIDLSISDHLPHLDTKQMMYAELGGLCFDKEVRGKGIANKMYKYTFDAIKELGCDFVVAEVVPNNLMRIIEGAKANGCKQVVAKRDQLSNDGLEDFRLFMSFKDKNELDLGYSEDLTKEIIAELIERRKELISKTK